MAHAYIVEALRTAGGKRGGALRGWHPADMGGEVLSALASRSGIDPAAIDDVIVGCVSQVGEQSFHIGRNMVLARRCRQRSCGTIDPPVRIVADRRCILPRRR